MLVGRVSLFFGETSVGSSPILYLCRLLLTELQASSCPLNVRPLPEEQRADAVPHAVGCVFTFWTEPFEAQKLFTLMKPNFPVFLLWWPVLLVSYLRPGNILKPYPLINVRNTTQDMKMHCRHPLHPLLQKFLVAGPTEESAHSFPGFRKWS